MKKIAIRAATVEDAPNLLKVYAPYVENTAVTFECEVPTAEEFARRIKAVTKKFPYLVAEEDGETVGYSYASPYRRREAYNWDVETSIYVKQNKRESGIGSRLYTVLEKLLAAQGIINVYASIACPLEEDEFLTMDSMEFHKRMGFTVVGNFHKCGYKFKRWYDMVWMEKQIGIRSEMHSPPLNFNEALCSLLRSHLKPDRKPATELVKYLKDNYSLTSVNNDKFYKDIEKSILNNKSFAEKLPTGIMPEPVCFCNKEGSIFVGIDLVTGYFTVDGSQKLYDALFAYRGLDEKDLQNNYLTAKYIQIKHFSFEQYILQH